MVGQWRPGTGGNSSEPPRETELSSPSTTCQRGSRCTSPATSTSPANTIWPPAFLRIPSTSATRVSKRTIIAWKVPTESRFELLRPQCECPPDFQTRTPTKTRRARPGTASIGLGRHAGAAPLVSSRGRKGAVSQKSRESAFRHNSICSVDPKHRDARALTHLANKRR